MAIKQLKICDCCRKQQIESGHWTENISRAILNLKDMPNIQRDYSMDLCKECSDKIKESLEEVINKIKLGKV